MSINLCQKQNAWVRSLMGYIPHSGSVQKWQSLPADVRQERFGAASLLVEATSLPSRCCLDRNAHPAGRSGSLLPAILQFSMLSPLICSSTIVTAWAQRAATLASVSRTFLRVGTCTSNKMDVFDVALTATFPEKQSVKSAQELLDISVQGLVLLGEWRDPSPRALALLLHLEQTQRRSNYSQSLGSRPAHADASVAPAFTESKWFGSECRAFWNVSLLKEQVPDKIATEQLNGFLLLFKSCEYLYSFPWKKG